MCGNFEIYLFVPYLFLDIFKFDPDYLANEEKYNQITKG